MQAKDKLYDSDIKNLENKNKLLSSVNSIYIIGLLIIFTILFIVLFNLIRAKRKSKLLFQKLLNEKTKKTTIIRKDFVTSDKVKTFLESLKKLEETGFYLKNECNLYTTAKLINTNTTYLSKAINEYKQQSFNDYINHLRIDHCRMRLKIDSKFRSYTIKAIAQEIGYKSVNTFAAAFKKQTGLSHSYYIKQIHIECKQMTSDLS